MLLGVETFGGKTQKVSGKPDGLVTLTYVGVQLSM